MTPRGEPATGPARLFLVGELDLASRDAIGSAVLGLVDGSTTAIELDMTEVTFIDGAGLGAVRAAIAAATGRGVTVRIAAMSRVVERLLDLAGARHDPTLVHEPPALDE